MYMSNAYRGQKRALEPELYTVLNWHVDAGKQTWVLWDISAAPTLFFEAQFPIESGAHKIT